MLQQKGTRTALLLLLLFPASAHAAAASGFEVETATRLWLDTLQGPARARSDAYFEGGYWLPLWATLVSVVIDLLILRLRITVRLREWAERRLRRPRWVTALTALGYALVAGLLALPWTIYSGFVREKQYGLMNLTFGGWLGEQAISFLILAIVTALLAMVIYAAIRRFPRRWWLLGTGIIAGFVVIGIAIAPVYIAPLFNTYTELPEGPVREQILAMAHANKVPTEHVYRFDASRQSKRISANVSGLGPTIRISLNDNLLNRSTEPEIAAVMGHELGHYVLGHLLRNIAALTLLYGLGLYLIARAAPWLIRRHGARWGIRDLADPASLPVLALCLAVYSLLMLPALNTLVRVNESEADAFGLDAAREPDGFAAIAMKLSEYRKIEPGPIEEALFFDHPSGATRVRMAMQWKKDNMSGAAIVRPAPLPQTFGED